MQSLQQHHRHSAGNLLVCQLLALLLCVKENALVRLVQTLLQGGQMLVT